MAIFFCFQSTPITRTLASSNCFSFPFRVRVSGVLLHIHYHILNPSRRMPGHIREFNRLEPHSSHDLVFKIWRNNKTEATFGVFCLWLWVTRNQISMGTTGIFISRNIKFKILPSINASLSDFTGFFALKTNQKIAIFVWIFACVDFREKIATKLCRNREQYHLKPPEISCLPLKPAQSFKPRIVIKTGVFVFLWNWPEPVRGSQREEKFQKTSLKARKIIRVVAQAAQT